MTTREASVCLLHFGGNMPSLVENDDVGRCRSREIRSQKADRLLWGVRSAILELARAGKLATTLAGIASQLNERGLRTNQNNKFDAQKVHRALGQLGVDRMAIKRWQNYAARMASQFNVPREDLIMQLWQEWLWHEGKGWISEGISLINREIRPFFPALVHPDDWTPPWEREPDSPLRKVPASPPAARVVYAMLGAFAQEQ